MTTYQILPVKIHEDIVRAAYEARGYQPNEAADGARFSTLASWHGIRTHNAIKALHLDHLFGSTVGGCVPGANIEVLPSRFSAVQRWDAHKKLGQSVAFRAMDTCRQLADEFGSGTVIVDNAFHYLWGGGYVIEAAKRGYIAYTACTSTLAEVVPWGGRVPTLGTNPHSWAFPTKDAVGFPICIDWATSTVAMGRVQQLKREGKTLPPGCAVDANGKETNDPNQVAALLPFGAHKGYGLSLIDELYGAFGGGSLPRLRGRPGSGPEGEKYTSTFYFQVIHPDSLASGSYACGRSMAENIRAVLADIRCAGNEAALLPGELEARAAALSEQHHGLLFTAAEISALAELAQEGGIAFNPNALTTIDA